MPASIIDGKAISKAVRDELKEKVAALAAEGTHITLAVILVGEDPASQVYVRNKMRACEYVGIGNREIILPDTTTQEELLSIVRGLNEDNSVNGILVQLPLPAGLDENEVIMAISPKKDVDGFHPVSVGALSIGLPGFVSCTPAGVIEMLRRSGVEMAGKECVIVGRSNIVGKPMAALMLRENATVTVCHSKTVDLPSFTRRADILILAVGRPGLIRGEDIKEGAVVIDCGINRLEDGRLCGDADFSSCSERASMITPVPGGVGPMTITMLMKNCVESVALNA